MDASSLNVILNIATVLLTGGMLGVVLKYRQGMRGLKVTDDADIRDHYAEELDRVIQRQRACELREESLRSRVAELESDVLGLIRIITQASADKVLTLDGETSEMIQDMARRIQEQHKIFR